MPDLSWLLAACGEAKAPSTEASVTPAPAGGVKSVDAAAWAKYAPWKSDLPEVVKTGTGLECVVLAEGPAGGVPPKASEQAEVFYEGRLNAGGPAFDSAFERDESATFPVNAVVAWLQRGAATDEAGRSPDLPAAVSARLWRRRQGALFEP